MKSLIQLIVFGVLFCSSIGCSAVRTTADVVGGVGKATWNTAKVTGKVLYKTGEVTYKTGKVVSKGVRSAVYMAKGKEIVPLERRGNSLYVDAKLNRKKWVKFLLDTGASSTQISYSLARDLGINVNAGEPVMVTIANGAVVQAREVNIREIRVEGVRISNVKALVLDREAGRYQDGLLGMTFLNHFSFSIDAQAQELVLQQKAL